VSTELLINAFYLQEEATRALRRGEPQRVVDEVLTKARRLGATLVRLHANHAGRGQARRQRDAPRPRRDRRARLARARPRARTRRGPRPAARADPGQPVGRARWGAHVRAVERPLRRAPRRRSLLHPRRDDHALRVARGPDPRAALELGWPALRRAPGDRRLGAPQRAARRGPRRLGPRSARVARPDRAPRARARGAFAVDHERRGGPRRHGRRPRRGVLAECARELALPREDELLP
jgi:hypothetical protein